MKLASGLLLCLFVVQIAAWGPVSHYYFARNAFSSNPNILLSSVKQACDFPDGTYFANFSEFPNCPMPTDDFHNPITAGYIYQFAVSSAGQKFKSSTFDPVSYALGFGSHMIADKVGFFPTLGYLGTVPNYVTFFPFMTAIDALTTTLEDFPLNEPWTSDEAIDFLAAATTYYNSVQESFPVFNSTQVGDCANPWAATDVQLFDLATFQVRTGYYKQALVFYDLFNATSFDEAASHFQINSQCAVSAIQFWASQMQQNTSPEQAYSNTSAYIAANFAKGDCYPSM